MLLHTAERFTEQKPLHRLNLPGAGDYDQHAATAFGSPEPGQTSPVQLVPAAKVPKAKRQVFLPVRPGDGLHESEYPGPGNYFPELIQAVRGTKSTDCPCVFSPPHLFSYSKLLLAAGRECARVPRGCDRVGY